MLQTRLIAIGMLAVVPWLADGQRQDLFARDDTVSLRIEAPFDDLFARAKRDPDYATDGTLVWTDGDASGEPVHVTISLRGHTSRRETECSFPKLKVSLAEGEDEAAFRGGGRSLKLGTHCGESEDDELTQKFGRLSNERSPWREAAIYRLLAALDVPTLRARPARVTYVYTPSAEGPSQSAPQTITRNAMLLEDEDDAVRRLGGTAEIEPEVFTTADALFSPADAATLAFAEALVGNFDWCVKFTETDRYRCDARLKLWNVIAAKMSGGKARPIMYDFDVSGMVTGSHRWFQNVYNRAFVASQSAREVEVIGQLQRTRSLFSRRLLDETRRRFADKRDAAYSALEAAPLDERGRGHIREYMDAFYREIGTDEDFYRPVVVEPDTMLRSAGSPNAPAVCTSRGPVPVGTPVSEPLASRNGMINVVVLDALWHWGPRAKCPAVQSGTAWIEAGAVSRDYPE